MLALFAQLTDLPFVMIRVDPSKRDLSTVVIPAMVQPNPNHRLIHKLPIHHRVKGRNHPLNRNRVIPEAQDPIKPPQCKSDARLLDALPKILLLNSDVPNGHHIIRDYTLQRTGAVTNGEFGAVFLVRGALRGVVAAVEETGDGGATGGRNPEVRGAGVKDNGERLRRRAF